MAPKAKSKAAKARAKAARLAAKLAAQQPQVGPDGEVIEGGVLAIPAPKPKAKSAGFAKKLMLEVGDKSVEEVIGDYTKKKQVAEAALAEAEAMETAQKKQVDEAKAECDAAKAEIEELTKKELEVATSYKALTAKRGEYTAKVSEKRAELYEAQKKVAMLEVLAVNHAKMKALEETRKKAQEAAAEAKRVFVEQRLREKEALEATRRALAQTRLDAKGKGRGLKRGADGTAKPDDAAQEAETLPATQAADID
jgi:chromosome segregation ATPase